MEMTEEGRMILRMLQDGKITAAEAETLLSALESRRGHPGGPEPPWGAARRSAKAAAKAAKEFLAEMRPERYVQDAMRQLDDAMRQVERAVRDMQPGKRVNEVVAKIKETVMAEQFGEEHRWQEAGAESAERDETVSFPEGTIQELSVSTPVGRIVAKPAEGAPTTVRVVFRATGPTAQDVAAKLEELVLDSRRGDGAAELVVRAKGGRIPSGCSADMEVSTAPGVSLALKSAHGPIEVNGINGDVSAEAVNGAVTISAVSGDVTAKSVNGNVEGTGISGDANLSTVNGHAAASNVNGDLKISSVNGAVEAADVTGDLRASSVNGGVTIANATGDVSAESVNGKLAVNHTTGDLSLKSLNGGIEVRGIAGGDVHARGGHGGITLEFAQPFSGDVTAETSSGHISVSLPRESSVRIRATSASGRVESNLPLTDEARSERSLSGTLGQGEGDVTLKTTSGAITLTEIGVQDGR
jgi:DUF4097 and DUF4098 domain-containing protein YvlB